ncbi:T9SS type A sorting domain-containing protein [bacterium]|nr:T9SS type A sorting domain-containing protein [bacterium]
MKTVKKSIRYYLLNCLIIIIVSFIGVNAQIDTALEPFNSSPIAMPNILDHIEITGPSEVDENSSGNYSCWANYSDGRRENVTNQTSWSENSDYASFDRPGHLVTSEVGSDQPCTIEAYYGGKRTYKSITIKVIPILNSIEIIGPSEIYATQSADYICMAYYSDGSQENITSLATWCAGSCVCASFDYPGHLVTSEINVDGCCWISTNFGGKTTNKLIKILLIIYDIIEIWGPVYVDENSNIHYNCVHSRWDRLNNYRLVYYYVTNDALWSLSSSSYASISSSGVLTTYEVSSDQQCTIKASCEVCTNQGIFITLGTGKGILIKDVSTPVFNSEKGEIPLQFTLSQNYPNPFNPSTQIRYSIPKQSFVTLTIYNQRGMEVESIVSEEKAPGEYEVEWLAEDYSSGIYLCRLEAGDFVETRKLILQK